MRTEVVLNDWGPLDRSVHVEDGPATEDVGERLENMEKHLGMTYGIGGLFM
jgi:hypothetical protein